MGLDIRIKENGEVVHECNFFGFKHFNNSQERHRLAHDLLKKYSVKNKQTYMDFIKKAVDKIRWRQYFNYIKYYKSEVIVEIY